MSIQNLLKFQSTWTWNIMQGSAQLGEMVREDALTSVNLASIRAQLGPDDPLQITSMQGAHLEQEFGADWFWRYGNACYLVQAKRLNVAPGTGGLSYLIDIDQLEQLLTSAELLMSEQNIDAKPAYVFYNSMLGPQADPGEYGCMFIDARALESYLESRGRLHQATAVIGIKTVLQDLRASSWANMFPPPSL